MVDAEAALARKWDEAARTPEQAGDIPVEGLEQAVPLLRIHLH